MSTLLLQSSYSEKTRERFRSFFRTSVAPLLGPSPDKSTWPVSSMCDDGTPVKIGWVFKPTGEMSVQFAIEALSPIDGSPITPQQNLIILQDLAIAGECHDFDLSWSRRCTQSLASHSIFSRTFHRPHFSHRVVKSTEAGKPGVGYEEPFLEKRRHRLQTSLTGLGLPF